MSQIITDVGREHLRWSLIDGVGPITFSRLLMQFGDAAAAAGATASELCGVKGIGRETAAKIVAARDAAWEAVERELAACAEFGVRVVARGDAEFPPGLLRIPDAPIVLYVRGELRPTDAVALAIVGSRRCTIYGSEQARRFGELLAGAGFTVVSGLARGIDSFAHHGAVDAGGRSLAVLGCGLNEVYPPENKALADKVLASGAWLSELPIRTAVRASSFPPRNRIIAGLSLGTLVVEAAGRSGALITARLASEYNREVFAIPGRLQDPMSIGTNGLIRDSAAKLVTNLEDILDGLGEVGRAMRPNSTSAAEQAERGESAAEPSLFARASDQPQTSRERSAAPAPALTSAEAHVYELISYDPVLQDAVMRQATLSPGEVLGVFTALELKGLIQRLPGQLVVRRGRA